MNKQKSHAFTKKIAALIRALGQPARLRILMTIGEGEACVCHLEAALGYRQAYISQHLMALREARILQSRREGRFVFYRLRDTQTLELIRLAGEIAGIEIPLHEFSPMCTTLPSCVCPHCEAEAPADVVESVGVWKE